MSERPPSPVVVPLTHDGIRYQQDDSLQPAGPGTPRGAYLAAFDAATGAPLWSALVYELPEDPDWPLDLNMDRRFTSLTLLPDASGIDVEDETRYHYRFDFQTRTVREVTPVPKPSKPQEDPLTWLLPVQPPLPDEDPPLVFPS